MSTVTLITAVAAHCRSSECDFLVVNALTAFVAASALLMRRYQTGAPPYDKITELRVFGLLSLFSFCGGLAGAVSDFTYSKDLRAAVAFTFLLLVCTLLSTGIAYVKWKKQVEVRKAWGGANGNGFGGGFGEGGSAVGPPMPYNVDDASSGGAIGGEVADDESFSYTAM